MPSLNQVNLIGHLTRQPELKYLPSQTAVVTFGLAINRTFKKQDGTKGEEVCFVDCTMFGKRGEALNKYFNKGDAIFVSGRLKLDRWDAKDGTKRQRLSVLAESFEFMQVKQQSGTQDEQPPLDDNYDNDVPF